MEAICSSETSVDFQRTTRSYIPEDRTVHSFPIHHYWQNSPYGPQPSLEYPARLHPVFTSFDFTTIIFLQTKVVSLASNPKPGGPDPCVYVPQWQGGPVIPPDTGFPFRRLVRLAGLRWWYSNPPPYGDPSNLVTFNALDTIRRLSFIFKIQLFGRFICFRLQAKCRSSSDTPS
jgi:hypothetical protein